MKRRDSGCYFLVIENAPGKEITIGKLGTFTFPAGFYVYTGSAMNSLKKRIGRHLSINKKLHWHIDYLLAETRIIFAGFIETKERIECQLNSIISGFDKAAALVPRFGSSDCNCKTHLFHFPGVENLSMILFKKTVFEINGKSYVLRVIPLKSVDDRAFLWYK